MDVQVLSLILGAIGTLGSVITGLTAYVRSRVRIRTDLVLFYKNLSGCLAYMTFTNQSYLSVSITDVRISINQTRYSCMKIPEMAFEKTRKTGDKVELLSREYTMAFPINLPSLSGTSGYLAFRIPQETLQSVSNDLIVELSTNRRRILKTQLTIPDLPKFLSR